MAEKPPVSSIDLSQSEEQDVEDRGAPRAAVVFETIRREGESELRRPMFSLAASGIAGGLSMGMSLAGEGLIRTLLPQASWAPLVSSFGYSLGFVIVVLGRQQLFTETTVTAILPLLDGKDRLRTFGQVLRLWIVVTIANLIGAAIFAYTAADTTIFPAAVRHTFLTIAHEAAAPPFWTLLVRGIAAGWLIALMVWMLPGAKEARLWVVVVMTYVVGLASLSHIVAGSVEVLFLVASGQTGLAEYFGGFLLPVFVGNALGGVLLVSLLNYGQVVLDPAE